MPYSQIYIPLLRQAYINYAVYQDNKNSLTLKSISFQFTLY